MVPFYQKRFDQMTILQWKYVFEAKMDQMQNNTNKF